MYRTMPEAIKHNCLLLNLFSEEEYEIQTTCKKFLQYCIMYTTALWFDNKHSVLLF